MASHTSATAMNPLVRVAGYAAPASKKVLAGPMIIKDTYYGGAGRGRIHGTVKQKATPSFPVHRRVRLYRERDGIFIRETWSDAVTGEYTFEHIDETLKYTVITYDYTNTYRAVAADNITPEIV